MKSVGSKYTVYEVVWCEKNHMYIWDYTMKGRDVFPTLLPGDVRKVYCFVTKKVKSVMVYRLKNHWTSYCSHCSNKNFGDARKWLRERGFKEGDKK